MTSPPVRFSNFHPQRRTVPKVAEVWDEDFEFPTIAIPKGKGKEVDQSARKQVEEQDDDSSVEDWTADGWDGSPTAAGPSRLPSPATGKRKSPETLGLAQLTLGSPRASSSQSSDLPLPRSPMFPTSLTNGSSSSSALQLIGSSSGNETSKQRNRSGSTSATRNKLIKRHPSTSFIPLGSSTSTDTLSKVPPFPVSRSSYDVSRPDDSHRVIHRAKSGEQMPPPPLPPFQQSSRPHIRSRTSSRPTSRQGEVRVSAIPLSPSNEPNRQVSHGKKPSLWKRWSGQQFMGEPKTAPGTYIQDSIKVHRTRSSSIGGRKPSENQDHPPVPPLPLNFRSPSANSNISSSSAASSSSNRSGPTRVLSVIRRSASSLSRKSDHSTPPSAYAHAGKQGGMSSTSINVPAEETTSMASSSSVDVLRSPATAAPHPFSPGFHLPSPSAGSPYRSSKVSPFSPPPLPHSASFPLGLPKDDSEGDTETEELDRTPRRKKIRPVSALPAPRPAAMSGWNGDGWQGFGGNGSSRSVRPEPLPIGQRSASAESTVQPARNITPRSPSFASSTANTLRRLGSMSKKHGRRLSGGFRFGPGPSTAEPRSPTSLAPVAGSPSKPSQINHEDDSDADQTEDARRAERGTSVSAPTSRIRNDQQSVATSSGPRKSETHRRRQSDTDIKFSLAIPASVLAKQEGFKKGNSALKQFANGLKPLRALLEAHADAQRRAMSMGNATDWRAFKALELEYDQYFEMATVLIELGNTSQGMTSSNRASSDTADRQNSLRSRRITLSADEARTAGDSLRSTFDSLTAEGTPVSQRHGSAPDPASHFNAPFSPPRATPDRWRASTGRQDLSKRQLEVLRNMLSTPVSDRPGLGRRQDSTSTNNSVPTKTVIATATMRHISRSTASDRSVSGGVSGSPASSTYIIPSGSFPSPGTAADLANPQRTSRSGLAGLKEFLRTMKTKPDGLQARSPPQSPTMRLRYPQTAAASRFADVSLDSINPPSVGLSSKQHKRPSIRNIFRSSSGNWSDLVRNDKRQESGSSTSSTSILPRMPSRSNLGQTALGRRISQKRRKDDPPPAPPLTTSAEDKTIRPGRKSRVIGLGWPEIDDASHPSSSSSTPPRPGPVRRSTTSHKEGHAHEKGMTEVSTWSDMPQTSTEEEITVAVTPDKLPFLLDYVKTCEAMLEEWKRRMEAKQSKTEVD